MDAARSVRLWSEEEINAESERIVNRPTCRDRVCAFEQFIAAEAHNLVHHAGQTGFLIQQAYNSMGTGPVAEPAARATQAPGWAPLAVLRHPSNRPAYEPLHALKRTLDSRGSRVPNEYRVYGENKDAWYVPPMALTADARRLVSGSMDNTLLLWDLETGQCLQTLRGHSQLIRRVAMTRDGRLAVTISDDNEVRLWDLAAGQCTRVLQPCSRKIQSIALDTERSQALCTDSDNRLSIWDLASGDCIETRDGSPAVPAQGDHAESARFWRSVVSRDGGTRVGYARGARELEVWDLPGERRRAVLTGQDEPITCVALSPDARLALTGDAGGTVHVWDIARIQYLLALKGHTDRVGALAVAPVGLKAVSGGEDGQVHVWDLARGRIVHTVSGPKEPTAVGVDNRYVVFAGSDHGLYAQDLQTLDTEVLQHLLLAARRSPAQPVPRGPDGAIEEGVRRRGKVRRDRW